MHKQLFMASGTKVRDRGVRREFTLAVMAGETLRGGAGGGMWITQGLVQFTLGAQWTAEGGEQSGLPSPVTAS